MSKLLEYLKKNNHSGAYLSKVVPAATFLLNKLMILNT